MFTTFSETCYNELSNDNDNTKSYTKIKYEQHNYNNMNNSTMLQQP